ncbi:FAD-dependent thymidylate synthase [Candidatus Dependentiae bacterium]
MKKVELLHCMGDDLMIVNAARVSFNRQSNWGDGEKGKINEKDVSLINYLSKNGHWTPFAHPQIQFRIKLPIIICRQWYRHTIGFLRSEVSRRYVQYEPEFFAPESWRQSSPQIKQGSLSKEVADPEACSQAYENLCKNALETYNFLLKQGVAPEQARMALPQSMYTEFVETASLYAYARFCRQRLDSHAQKEIRDYAKEISDIIAQKFPVAWKALMQGVLVTEPQQASGKEASHQVASQ